MRIGSKSYGYFADLYTSLNQEEDTIHVEISRLRPMRQDRKLYKLGFLAALENIVGRIRNALK